MRYLWLVLAMVTMATTVSAQSGNPYLQAPIFQDLPPMELRVEAQFGYGDTGDLPVGLLGGFGIGLSDALTIGGYGQVTGSDRDLPAKVEHAFGLGGFVEYQFQVGTAVVPYVGLRLGLLDLTGPGSPSLPYAGGIAGVKYPLTEKVALTVALTLHWAGEEGDYAAYNYDRSENSYSDDTTDMTIDAGMRYTF